jgi:hypothetical protein
MRRPLRFVAHAAAAAALLVAAAAPATDAVLEMDEVPTGEQMALDLIIVRPLSLAGTVLGIGVFVVALPINALTLNFKEPARRLVLEPAQYTFVRRLGDLD